MKTIRKVALFLIIIFGIIVFRIYIGSISNFHVGDEALIKKHYDIAMDKYEKAIRWYVPGNPFSRQAVENMTFICRTFLAEKQYDKAYNCFDRVRGSIFAVRSFYVPYPEFRKKIERFMIRCATKSNISKQTIEHALSIDMAPKLFGVLMALFGFAGWIIFIVLIILNIGLSKPIKYLYFGAGATISFTLWIIGLYIA